MRFLNPIDCDAARDCMRQGNFLEAAGILLESKDRQHRAVRKLLLKIGPQLAEKARQAYANGDLSVAREFMSSARQCAPLSPEDEALRDRIVQDCEERSRQRRWQAEQMRRATAWAEQGRICSAIAMIRPLEDDPEAVRRGQEWREKLDRLQRYVREFEDFVQQGELVAAEAVLRKARRMGPAHPQVLGMEKAWRQCADVAGHDVPLGGPGGSPPGENSVVPNPIDDRGKIFGLEGLNVGNVLVVSQPVVVVGAFHSDWCQLPMLAPLHRQHALILREPEPTSRTSRYRVVPFVGCHVSVGGTVVADSRTLKDGDLIQFGSDQCQWIFRQFVSQSDTVILERRVGASGCVCTRDQTEFSVVVLMGGRLAIGSELPDNGGECHFDDAALPARKFCLEWRTRVLAATVEWLDCGGAVFAHAGELEIDGLPEPICMPCEITLYAELQGLDLVEGTGADRMRLRIWDPNRVDEESQDGLPAP